MYPWQYDIRESCRDGADAQYTQYLSRGRSSKVYTVAPRWRVRVSQKEHKAYDEDLQWRLVYQKFALELSYREIATNLNVDPFRGYWCGRES